MEIGAAISLAVGAVLAVCGWLVGHHFSRRRDVANKKREYCVQQLAQAYQQLANACDRQDFPENLPEIQSSLNSIQPLGTEAQIVKVGQFVENMRTASSANIDELLSELRNTIRDELKLERVHGRRWRIRVERKD